jgi:hypothetical protein
MRLWGSRWGYWRGELFGNSVGGEWGDGEQRVLTP